MVRVITLVESRTSAARIQAGAHWLETGLPRIRVDHASHWSSVAKRLRRGSVDAVIFEVNHPSLPRHPKFTQHVRRHTQVAWVIYGGASQTPIQRVVDLARAGVRVGLTPGIDDQPDCVSGLLRRVVRDNAQERLLQLALPDHSVRHVGFLRQFLHYAPDCRTVSQIAANLRTSERTLERRAGELGLPSPAHVLTWCRVHAGATMLMHGSATIETAADTCGFSSPAAFRRAMKRVTGLGISEIRELTSSTDLAERFASALGSPPSQLSFRLPETAGPLLARRDLH